MRALNAMKQNLLFALILFFGLNAYSQGSRSLYPDNADGNRAFLVCTTNPGANANSWPYLTLGVHYVYAKEGELVAAAFSGRSTGSSGGTIRITSPTGIEHLGSQYNTNGRIASRAQELAGPYNGSGWQGNRYTPFTVDVTSGQAGVWKVEFLPVRNNTAAEPPTDIPNYQADANWAQVAGSPFIAAWDISVRPNYNGSDWIPGRVYTNVLNLILPQEWEEDESFYADMFILTKDGVPYKITYNGNQGAGWTFFTNNKGFLTAQGEASYKSLNFSAYNLINPYLHDPRTADDVVGNFITHKMFYTEPASDLPGTSVAIAGGGTTWLKNVRVLPEMDNLTFVGAEGTPGQSGSKGAYISFDSNVKGLYKITIPSASPKVLTGPCVIGENTVFWDGTDGNGNPLPAGTAITHVTTQLFGAEVHFPYIDMEINPNGIVIQQLDDDYDVIPGMDKIYWDDTNITGGAPSRRPNPMFNGNSGNGVSSLVNGHRWGDYTTATVNPSGTPLWTGQPDNDGMGAGDFGNTRSIDTWSYAPGDEDSAALEIVVMATDLKVDSVTKISGPNIVSVGNNLTYDVAIFNNGPSDATTAATEPATFMFYAPPGITINPNAVIFVNATGGAVLSGTKTFDAATGIFSVKLDMPNQSGGTFRIPVSVTGGVPDDKVNVWGAMMRPKDISDPNASNPDVNIPEPVDAFEEANGIHTDSSELPIYTDPTAVNLASTNNIKLNDAVQMYANVGITKTVTPGPHTIGQQVTFTITASNTGASNASDVKVTDLLNTRYTYVSHTASNGNPTYNPATGLWTIGTLNNGANAILTITATINPTGAAQINTATITADEYDTLITNNTASATTNAPQTADVAVTKTGIATDGTINWNSWTYNGSVTYTITIHNNGPTDATNIVVTDNLQSQYSSPTSYSPSTGTVVLSGTGSKNITWTIPFLANGGTATLVFTSTYSRSVFGGFQSNTASATQDQTDPNTGNNTSTITPPDGGVSANLEVAKQVSNPTPNVGATVTFTISAAKLTGTAVSGVTVTDVLPIGYTFVSANASIGNYNTGTGVWTLGNISNSTVHTLTIQAKVNAPQDVADEYKNTATINGTNVVDGQLLNNVATATVDPLLADLDLEKTANASAVRVGSPVEFTITIDNNGPDPAVGVSVADLLPAGYTFVSYDASQGSYNSGTGVWTVGNMANGARHTLDIVATVKGAGDMTNVATVSATTYDTLPSNNSDSLTITRKKSYLITNPMVRSRVH